MFKKLLAASIFMFASTGVMAQDANSVKEIDLNPTNSVVESKDGKPTVVEFFWYGCPHCYHMEPLVEKLLEEKKDTIVFKRYPVAFPRWESGAQLYFTIESMGLENQLHSKIFTAIQKDRNNLMDDKNKREEFLKKEGIDVDKFNNVYSSFSINAKLGQAKQVVKDYKLDSSPVFVVNDKYMFAPSINGSYENTITGIKQQLDKLAK